ncbi:MAG: hypothetical protein GXO27_00210 [Chlorobi bacterium]|nr:hypothetical protein [Chlorobiota bacterium]
MTESAYYESLGVFFNADDAQIFLNVLKENGLPVKVDLLSFEDRPDEFFGLEIFTKKSAVEPALALKKELVRKTLDNPSVFLYHIPDEELLQIPWHPEDVTDFDYWAALELIKQKGLPLEDRDWEAFRQERLLELYEQKIPRQSGLWYAGLAVFLLGLLMLAVTYRTLPLINLLFFAGSMAIGRIMTRQTEYGPSEVRKGKGLMIASFVMMMATLVLSYLYML